MTLQKSNISESLAFSYINTSKFKSSALSVSLCMPLRARDYLFGLVLAGVMRRGTEGFPSMAKINRRLDMLYASNVDLQCIIRGDVLCFCVSADMLEQRFSLDGTDISGGVIDAISDILLNPVRCGGKFPADTVESEKQIVRDSLSAETNDTGIYAGTRLKELLCREASREFPTLEYLLGTVDSITPEELTQYHVRLLACPVSVFYVGGENADNIRKKLERHLGAFADNTPLPRFSPRPHGAAAFADVCEDREVNQGKLCLGMRSGIVLGDSRSPSVLMFNEVFGGSPASKLFLGIREKLSLCYYCYSSYSMLSGNISVSSGIEVKNRDTVTEKVLESLEEIQKGNITDTEITAAKKSLELSYIQIYDSPFALASFYFVRSLFGVEQTVEDCRTGISGVTAEDICKAATGVSYDTRYFLNGTGSADTEDTDE